jgi:septum formation protein
MNHEPISFVLASASVARRKLLQMAGIEPIICTSNFDESQIQLDDTAELVNTLAKCKAETVADRFADALILGCDSVLELNGEVYGKPQSPTEAIARWQNMRGKQGNLYTGHILIDRRQNKSLIRCAITKVYFAQISDRTIVDYVQSGEPLKCAGSFALEGRGGLFVEKIEGCHSNIIGLSLPLLRQMLDELGYNVTNFWSIDRESN